MSNQSVPIQRRASRWIRQRLLHSVTPDGFTPITEFTAEDIFVAGYPKSGNTWFQTLIAGTVYGVIPEHVPMSLVLELVPDVHCMAWYKRHSAVTFFKSHHLPDPRYRRVIYLLRDGRDAMVSYWHHEQAMKGQASDLIEFMRDETNLFPCKWHKHVQAWFNNPFGAEMMLVRYEDLKDNPVKELHRVCEFAGLKRSDEILELAARSASFDKMRAKELTEGPFSQKWPKDKTFCRRGVVGGYRSEMPREALDIFMQESAPALRECGYA